VDVEQLSTATPVLVKSPVKAHLKDGATVVYPEGVSVTADALQGAGTRHDVRLQTSMVVHTVPLGEVIGMETYRTRVNTTETALLSTAAAVGGVFATAALMVAIFGSCPTVYSADGSFEEAELFSNSIAPLFEGRDVARLRTAPDGNGMLELEIRNEAMETHYINHLELLEVTHLPDERVLPDHEGAPVVVSGLTEPRSALNRDGRDVLPELVSADGRFYATDVPRIERATAADMDDWIDVSVPVQRGATEAAVVFRMRNSLLNTILLYDVMLGPAGAAALDWLGDGLGRISTAVELGRWHHRRAGLHLSVWRDGSFHPAVRVPDSGPIFWHDVAAVIPIPTGEDTLRLRVAYVSDHWRLDNVSVGFGVRRPVVRAIPLESVRTRDGRLQPHALANMRDSDETHLQTNPGQAFVARFDSGAGAGPARTFLLSSQGYYTEWIRGSWIREAKVREPFIPNDTAVLEAMQKWSRTREGFERQFLEARVPVR
jgi:hypothetical protein